MYGRRISIIGPMFVFICFSAATATATTIQTILITRFFAGLMASAVSPPSSFSSHSKHKDLTFAWSAYVASDECRWRAGGPVRPALARDGGGVLLAGGGRRTHHGADHRRSRVSELSR